MRRGLLLVLVAAGAVACGQGRERASTAPAPEQPTAPAAEPAISPPFPFIDVTTTSGIAFVHDNGATGERLFPETMGPGLALFDADGDDDLDLYLVDSGPLAGPAQARPPNRLYLNRGDGTFDDATAASGADDRGFGVGAAVGDYDGDGDPDLYVLNYGPNVLYRNLGEGRFEAVEAGVGDPAWSVAAAFLDYDGDQDLDLYVVNYLLYDAGRERPCRAGSLRIYCSPEQFPPAPDRLYRNDGGRFTDVSREVGLVPGRGMGVVVGDLDRDGDPDLYVTNDRSPNQLYRNDGGRFAEIAAESGVGYGQTGQIEGGMGAVVADFTGSGRPSIFLTNFQKEPNRLYVPIADGFFDDKTFPSGLGFPSLEKVSWGLAALDVEGDGDLDLAVANGHVYDNAAEFIRGSSYEMSDQLFLNDGGGRFDTLEFPGAPLSSRGLAAGDLDADGDPDLVIASCGGPARVWRNDAGRPQRFLLVGLIAGGADPGAYGARVTARIGDRELHREIAGGGGYASHGDRRVYLGLGDAATVEAIETRWPDGSVETVEKVAGGQSLLWRQGEGIVSRRPLGRGGSGERAGRGAGPR